MHTCNPSTWKVETGRSEVKNSLCYKKNSKLTWTTENCLDKHSKSNQNIKCFCANMGIVAEIRVQPEFWTYSLQWACCHTMEHQLKQLETFLLFKSAVHNEVQCFYYICKVFCTFRNIIINGKTIIFYCHQLLFVKLVWFWWRTVAWVANLHTNTDTHTHAHTCTNCIMKLTWDEGRILISKTALIIVLLFCISYLCEVAFSALLFIKSKYRSTANSLDPTVLQIQF